MASIEDLKNKIKELSDLVDELSGAPKEEAPAEGSEEEKSEEGGSEEESKEEGEEGA